MLKLSIIVPLYSILKDGLKINYFKIGRQLEFCLTLSLCQEIRSVYSFSRESSTCLSVLTPQELVVKSGGQSLNILDTCH